MTNAIEVRDESGRHAFYVVNPGDKGHARHRYVLEFGAYGWTRCMVWANSLDAALDEAVDLLAEVAPGLLADEEVWAEADRLIAGGARPDEAYEAAVVDVTVAGSEGHCLHSWEWVVALADPLREDVLRLLGRA